MEDLRLHEEDDLEFEEGVEETAAVDQSLCLVGRFLTDRNIRVPTMKDRMAEVWRPGRGIQIDEVGDGLFAFQFYHQLDIQKVLQLGPWSFDKHLLVLGVLQQGMQPQDVPLNHVPFWVQVHGVPTGFMSETVGKSIANFIGEFLEYDVKNTANFWRPFMRIRVMVDVREPLKRSKRIKKQGGEAKTVTFKYERLEIFCYLCGRMGHAENACELRFTMGVDDGVRGWGPELRVENRRAGGGGGRSRWLRDGNDPNWVSPAAVNASKNFGGIYSSNASVSTAKEGANSKNKKGGPESSNANHEGDKSSHGNAKFVDAAAFFKDPVRYFPVKTADKTATNIVRDVITDDVMSDAEIIEQDRKRKKGCEGDSSGDVELTVGNNTDSAGVSVSATEGLNEMEGGVRNNDKNSQHFLAVGLGDQAYRDQ